MARAAQGEARAFSTLVTRHEAAMRRFCTSILADASLGRDAAQLTFLRLWEARQRFDPDANLQAFMYTIARNGCRSMQRRRAVAHIFSMGLGAEPSSSSHENALEDIHRTDITRAIHAGLQKLPLKFREPLVLRFFEGLDYDAIARVIERTPSAARSRVFYGLKALARILPPEVNPWTHP